MVISIKIKLIKSITDRFDIFSIGKVNNVDAHTQINYISMYIIFFSFNVKSHRSIASCKKNRKILSYVYLLFIVYILKIVYTLSKNIACKIKDFKYQV